MIKIFRKCKGLLVLALIVSMLFSLTACMDDDDDYCYDDDND